MLFMIANSTSASGISHTAAAWAAILAAMKSSIPQFSSKLHHNLNSS